MELITVVIPVYNAENTLEDCVESVCGQSYTSFEVLLINDGSTDKSGDICEKLTQKYNNIKSFTIENNGVSNARNVGIRYSKGKYISFVDADDVVDSDFLTELYSLTNKEKCMGVVGIKKQHNGEVSFSVSEKMNISSGDFMVLEKHGLLNSVNNKLYNRKYIIQNELYFDTKYKNGEDCMFNLQYFRLVDTIKVSDKALYTYNMNDSGLHSEVSFDTVKSIVKMHSIMLECSWKNKPQIDVKMIREYTNAIRKYALYSDVKFFVKVKNISKVTRLSMYKETLKYIEDIEISRNYRRLFKINSAFIIALYFNLSKMRKIKRWECTNG